MAGDIKNKYGANNQTITITLASLGNGSERQSTAIDNSTNVFQDVLVFVKAKSGASAVSAAGYLNVYAFGSVDGGTTYSENAGASDAAITLTNPPNVPFIGQVNMVANATSYYAGPFSVAQAFGGSLPDHWGIIIENKTGAALDATGGNFAVIYQGVLSQYT